MDSPLPGAVVRIARMAFARQFLRVDLGGGELREQPFLFERRGRVDPFVHRRAELAGQLDVARAGIDAERGRDLRREQAEHDAVLVGGPRRAVDAQERRAGAFLAAEAERPVEQAVHEPLEPDRHFDEAAAQSLPSRGR